jgi:signal peptidase II
MKHKGFFLLFIGLVLSDQLSKQIFMSSFELGQSMVLNPYLSWTYLHNTGAAFSILSDGGMMQKLFLLGVSTLVSLWLVWWTQRTPDTYRQKLLGQFFLLSGAVGNLIDRALHGFVIDFIDVHVNTFYWPVFNLADSFIFIGVALIIFERKSSTK